jgi:hypothetical protein
MLARKGDCLAPICCSLLFADTPPHHALSATINDQWHHAAKTVWSHRVFLLFFWINRTFYHLQTILDKQEAVTTISCW